MFIEARQVHAPMFLILTHLNFQLKCCGVNSSSDWRNFKDDGKSVPDSCCLKPSPGCGDMTMTDPDKVYQKVRPQ